MRHIILHLDVEGVTANTQGTRVILHPEASGWVARGIEFNITGRGAARESAMANFIEAIEMLVSKNVKSQRSMFDGIRRQPHVFPIVYPGERDILALAEVEAPI